MNFSDRVFVLVSTHVIPTKPHSREAIYEPLTPARHRPRDSPGKYERGKDLEVQHLSIYRLMQERAGRNTRGDGLRQA